VPFTASVSNYGGTEELQNIRFGSLHFSSFVGFEFLTAGVLAYNALLAICVHAIFLHGLYFDPEDGGEMFLRNVG
jgi:hypothetical protein